MTIAVDFDGTIVRDKYPEIGAEIPFATATLKMLQQEEQHRLILWTVRQGKELDDAIEWCKKRGVEFYAVNKDFPEENEERNRYYSRKIKADMFIDDRAVGGLPDWGRIYRMIKEKLTYDQLVRQEMEAKANTKSKKWWQF